MHGLPEQGTAAPLLRPRPAASNGAAPWRYESFLDAMTERRLLKRDGNNYLFAHHLLCDELASQFKFRPHHRADIYASR
jgi:hypothetical protein